MSKFKIGDEVKIINLSQFGGSEPNMYNVCRGDKGSVVGYYKKCENFAIVHNPKFKRSNAGDGKVYVPFAHLELFGGYSQSNRYKLQQAIKATGFKIGELSLATGNSKTYLTGFAAESRFNSRGDITEDRLNSLLTTLAFAERELLGVGVETVDDNNVSIGDSEAFKVVSELNNSAFDSSKQIHNAYVDYYADAKNDKTQKDSKVKNFLIVFLIFVVILSIYFLTR